MSSNRETVVLGNGTTVELSDIVDNPEKYGFTWEYEHLMKNGSRVTMGRGAPRKLHVDRAKCEATFGERFFIDQSNGTSARVKDQTIRDELSENIPMRSNERAMCEWIVKNALGAKTRKPNVTIVERTVYADMAGISHESLSECQAANLAYLVDRGMEVAAAREMLNI